MGEAKRKELIMMRGGIDVAEIELEFAQMCIDEIFIPEMENVIAVESSSSTASALLKEKAEDVILVEDDDDVRQEDDDIGIQDDDNDDIGIQEDDIGNRNETEILQV